MKVGLSEDAELYKQNASRPEKEHTYQTSRKSQIVKL